MGKADRRHSNKMRRNRSQVRLKTRLKRRAAAKRAERRSTSNAS